jgi:hypothetical protein
MILIWLSPRPLDKGLAEEGGAGDAPMDPALVAAALEPKRTCGFEIKSGNIEC